MRNILNKEGTIEFLKAEGGYKLKMTKLHPFWNDYFSRREYGGIVEELGSISWDSWVGFEVSVGKGVRIEGRSCILSSLDAPFMILNSYLSGVYVEFRKTMTGPNILDKPNTIINSDLRGQIRLTEIVELNIENSKLDCMFVGDNKTAKSIEILDSQLEGDFILDRSSFMVKDSKFKGEYIFQGAYNLQKFNNSNMINSAIIGANDTGIFNNKLRTENYVTGFSEAQD